MPKFGYKQTPAHRAKILSFQAKGADERRRVSKIYMEGCAKRYGVDVKEYRRLRSCYCTYRYRRQCKKLAALSFDDYLLARQVRATKSLAGVPAGPKLQLIAACAARNAVRLTDDP